MLKKIIYMSFVVMATFKVSLGVSYTNSLKVPLTSLSSCQGLSKYQGRSKYPSKYPKVSQSIPQGIPRSLKVYLKVSQGLSIKVSLKVPQGLSKYPSKCPKVSQSIPQSVPKSYPKCLSSFSLTRPVFFSCSVEQFKRSQRPKHDTSIPQTKQQSGCIIKKKTKHVQPYQLPTVEPLESPHSFHHTAHTAAKFKKSGPRVQRYLRRPHVFRSELPKFQMETNTECQNIFQDVYIYREE